MHVWLPEKLYRWTYSNMVQACLSGSFGPCAILPLGILRKIPGRPTVVLTHPSKDMKIEREDILILLGSQAWLQWARKENLYCVAGKPRHMSRATTQVEEASEAFA